MTRYDDLTADECQNCGEPELEEISDGVWLCYASRITWDGDP